MSSNTNTHDDFTAIKGIGPARERWLRDNFDVKTYQDLVNLNTSQIEARLKVDGKIVARTEIESWISQARELIPKSIASKQVNEASPQGVLAKKLKSSGHENGWKPFASFLVYFQTREKAENKTGYQTLVHHIEKDRETSWSGIETSRLSAWMLEQISDFIDLEQEEVAGESSEDSKETMSLPEITIQDVRIFQSSISDMPIQFIKGGQFLPGELHHDQPFSAGIDFSLSREVAADIVEKGITCFARCYQYNKSTRNSVLLAETSPLQLETSKLNYTLNIPEASLPRGDYRMVIMVTTSQTDQLNPDFLELSSIRVN